MRVFILSVFCSLAFVACQNKNAEIGEEIKEAMRESEKEAELVGADVDANGCKGSAGYTWSKLREDCIRVFEEGATLLPVKVDESEAVYGAFILYSEDKSTIELFLPSLKESVLLQKTENDSYKLDSYRYDEREKTLYIDGQAKYKEDEA